MKSVTAPSRTPVDRIADRPADDQADRQRQQRPVHAARPTPPARSATPSEKADSTQRVHVGVDVEHAEADARFQTMVSRNGPAAP